MIIQKTNFYKPEYIFLTIGFIFGFLFLYLTPIFKVPDEPMHLLRACEVSCGVLFNNKDGNPAKDIFPNRKALLRQNCACFQEFKYKSHYIDLFDFKHLNYTHNNTGYSFIMYIPSALAIKSVSLFTQNPYILFYSARLANFFTYLFFVFLAIKISPVFKWQILITSLFPMALYEGMSLSADSFNISFTFLFIALMFDLIWGKDKIIPANKLYLFFFLSFISVFLKGSFIFTLLSFCIPKQKLNNRNYIIWLWFLLLLGLTYLYSSNNFIFIHPNVDFYARKQLLTDEPLNFLRAFINTISSMWKWYVIQSICALDWCIVNLYSYMNYSFLLLFILASLLGDTYCRLRIRIFSFLLCVIFIFTTLLLFYLTYTTSTDFIVGVQGRYFLPLYLLMAICIQKPVNISLSDKQCLYLKTLIILSLCINLIITLKSLAYWFL